ncbi:MAG: hypothetical protein IPO85_04335 [Saprospiraceae bacterium]|uniref:Uncharacterized protein n=1 Tax=Candidatus Defluviibacterium haderslevense TaxID=2981993 RepID=A0A9D7S7Q2_9BACT|nr:hypothetical protein [Candidatus Defluviibacterium haderslevense]
MTVIDLTPDIVRLQINNFIEIESFFQGKAWNLDNFLLELKSKWEYSIGLINDNNIVGYIIASSKEDFIHIHRFAIKNELKNLRIRFLITVLF